MDSRQAPAALMAAMFKLEEASFVFLHKERKANVVWMEGLTPPPPPQMEG